MHQELRVKYQAMATLRSNEYVFIFWILLLTDFILIGQCEKMIKCFLFLTLPDRAVSYNTVDRYCQLANN